MKVRPALPEAEFEKLVQPKLKLFLSVDIVGSTNFKQLDPRDGASRWVEFFISFYNTFPDELLGALVEHDGSLPKPRLWKALGDELIFTVTLKKRRDAWIYVSALATALRSTAANWHRNDDPSQHELHLKGAAWLVGFPVANVEIPLHRTREDATNSSDEAADDLDYIGPLVDIGFRLKEHASSRRLVLSADLALMMLRSQMSNSMKLRFDGDAALKGVLGGRPYPIVWLDNDGHPSIEHKTSSAELNRQKDILLNRNPPAPEDLSDYLKSWLASVKGCPHVPFIREDPHAEFPIPSDYDERLAKAQSDLRKVFYPQSSQDIEEQGDSNVPSASEALLEGLNRL